MKKKTLATLLGLVILVTIIGGTGCGIGDNTEKTNAIGWTEVAIKDAPDESIRGLCC